MRCGLLNKTERYSRLRIVIRNLLRLLSFTTEPSVHLFEVREYEDPTGASVCFERSSLIIDGKVCIHE